MIYWGWQIWLSLFFVGIAVFWTVRRTIRFFRVSRSQGCHSGESCEECPAGDSAATQKGFVDLESVSKHTT